MLRRLVCTLLVVFAVGCGPTVEISRTDPAPSADPHPVDSDTAVASGEPLARPSEEAPRVPESVTLALAGDVHGEPPVATLLAEGGDPLDSVAPLFAAADLTVVNLETAVGTAGTPAPKQFTFQADATLLDALAGSGVDVVSVANNHSLDFGVAGLNETLALARDAGLAVVGGGRDADEAYAPHYATAHGKTVAVIGLTRVIPVPDWAATEHRPGLASTYEFWLPRAVAAIEQAREQADWVVVTVHWGSEGEPCPNGAQTNLARAFVDAGADVVAGHHPHVLQGIQQIDGAVVAYSLGNFVWYAASEAGRATGVLSVDLQPERGAIWQLHPALIDATGSPRLLAGGDPDHARQIADVVADRSPGGSACAHIDWP